MTLVKLGFVAAALATFGLAFVAREEPAIMGPLMGFGGLLLGSLTREIGAPK